MKLNFKQGTAAAVCFGSLLWGGAAYADGWPSSVAGNWSVVANQTTGTLSITQPASNQSCQPITGTLLGEPIQGFYCPSSGRIAFLRKNANGITYQHYQGNLAQGGPERIGGSFTAFGNSSGEYSFYATK